MCTDQTSVALLKSEEICAIMFCLKLQHLLSNELESCQNLYELHAVALRHLIYKVCCNDRLDQCAILRQSLCRLDLAELIFRKQTSRHISGQAVILAILILYIHTETVCIWIRCENEICVMLLCKCKCKLECFCCLRVWIAYSWEIAIWQFLLWNNIYILKAKFTQNSSGWDISRSMQWCIYNL